MQFCGALTLVAGLLACTGAIQPGSSSSSTGGTAGASSAGHPAGGAAGMPTSPAACAEPTAPAPLRRLDQQEWTATVQAWLPKLTLPALALPQDRRVAGFTSQPDPLSDDALSAYLDAAQAVGDAVAAKPADALAPCTSSDEATCVDRFLERAGRWAFRRALTGEERARWIAKHWKPLRDAGESAGVALGQLTARVLMSPRFLYHLETGSPSAGSDVVVLDGPSLAERLSYLIVGAPPDDALFALGSSGAISKPEAREAEARRLLDDQRAPTRLAAFVRQWLDLDRIDKVTKDPSVFAGYDDAFKGSMLGEARRVVERIARDGRPLRDLFTSRTTFVDARVAPIYGVGTGSVDADGFRAIELPASDRPGLLGSAAFLAGHANALDSSIIHRGLAVRRQLLCLDVPPPGPSIVPDKQVDRLTTQPCAGCHGLIDPMGKAFEGFDAVGRARTTVGGKPVDTTGEIRETDEIDGKVTGAAALVERVIDSDLARSCLSRQWATYALAREVDASDDACTLTALRDAAGSGAAGSFEDLVIALVRAPSFTRARDAVTPSSGGTCR